MLSVETSAGIAPRILFALVRLPLYTDNNSDRCTFGITFGNAKTKWWADGRIRIGLWDSCVIAERFRLVDGLWWNRDSSLLRYKSSLTSHSIQHNVHEGIPYAIAANSISFRSQHVLPTRIVGLPSPLQSIDKSILLLKHFRHQLWILWWYCSSSALRS